MNKNIETLKKRTKGDSLCCFFAVVIAFFMTISELKAYIVTEGNNPEHLINSMYGIFAFVIMLLMGLVLFDLHKNGKPFSKKIINLIRAIAIVTIFAAIVPDSFTPILDEVYHVVTKNSAVYIKLDIGSVLCVKNIFISLIGVVIGISTEIFVYGRALQDDVDSIA